MDEGGSATYNLKLATRPSAEVTPTDDDDLPVLSIKNVLLGDEGDKGVTNLTHRVTLNPASGRTVTVKYADTGKGTATSGTGGDYAALSSGTLSFAPGETSKFIAIKAYGDTDYEPDESIVLRLTEPVNATLASGGNTLDATGLIENDDAAPAPTVDPGDITVEEGESAVFTLTREHDFEELTVSYGTSPGSADEANNDAATPGVDYVAYSDTSTAVFKEGEDELTLEFETEDDDLHEAPEDFTVTITSGDHSEHYTVTIADNDDAPTVTLALASSSISEKDGRTRVTASLDRPTSRALGLEVGVTPVDPAVPGDIKKSGHRLTIAAGTKTSTGVVALTGVDNNVDAPDKTVTVFALLFGNDDIDDPTDQTLTITDDDDAPTLSVRDASAAEGAALSFTASLSAASGHDVTFSWRTAADGDGDHPAGAADYTAVAATAVTIAAGATTAALSVSSAQDTLDEEDETFLVQLSAATNATIGDAEATGTITDNDAATATVSVGDATAVAEGDDPAATVDMSFPLTLSAASGRDVTVTYTLGGTATAPGDYTAPDPLSVTIAAGSTTGAIVIPVRGDTLDEANETVEVALASATNATLSGVEGATEAEGTITDDDTATLSIDDVNAAEGGSAAFTVTLSTPSAADVTVTATTSEGTATAPEDYTHKAQDLTIAAGDTTAAFSVALASDSLDELDETFTVTLSGASGATISDATGTGTIAGNADTLISIADASAREGQSLSFTLTRSGDLSAASSVTYTTGDDPTTGAAKATATGAQADYTRQATAATVSFLANAATATITVATRADALVEGDETFRVNLAAPGGASLAGAFATGTITEGTSGYAVADASADEGDSLGFTVTRSGFTGAASSVSWSTADDTADGANQAADTGAARDYTPQATAAALAFAIGDTTKTITVATREDIADEPDETFRVALSAPGATVALVRGAATGTIVDDDATTVTLAVPDATATEGRAADTARITLTLNRGLVSGESLGVPLAFDGGTAGTHFTLALASPAPAGVTLSGTTVTFTGPTTGATATSAAVLLSASPDDDSADRTVTVSIPSASTGSAPILAASGLGGGATGSRTGDGEITLAGDGDAPTVTIE
ncbi:MAG: hypothetical protein OXP08_07430, partial [bacterium]|nr:hypothetical protein [bacterium]